MSNLSDRELARRLRQWINDRPVLDATHDELAAHIGYGLAEECLERLDPPADIGMVSLAAALGAVPDVIDLRTLPPVLGPDGSVVE